MTDLYLPAYFVIDSSVSMSANDNEAWDAALSCVDDLQDEMKANPSTAEKLRVEVITFDEEARVIIPLGGVENLEEWGSDPTRYGIGPDGAWTKYGKAFEKLKEQIDLGVTQLRSEGAQVFRPVVFFITDGRPTKESDQERMDSFNKLVDPSNKYHPNIICVGVGDEVTKNDLLPYSVGKQGGNEMTPGSGSYQVGFEDYVFVIQGGANIGDLLRGVIQGLVRSLVQSITTLDGAVSQGDEVPDAFSVAFNPDDMKNYGDLLDIFGKIW